jgi:hypothetical protein
MPAMTPYIPPTVLEALNQAAIAKAAIQGLSGNLQKLGWNAIPKEMATWINQLDLVIKCCDYDLKDTL